MATDSSSLAKDVDDVFGALLATKPKYEQEEEKKPEEIAPLGEAAKHFDTALSSAIDMPAGYQAEQTPYSQLGPEAKKVQFQFDSLEAGTDPKKLRKLQADGEPLTEDQERSIFKGERDAPLSEQAKDVASGFGHAVKSLVWDDLLVGGGKTIKAAAAIPMAMAKQTYTNDPNASDEEARQQYAEAEKKHQEGVDAAKDEAYKAARSFTSGVVQGVEGLTGTAVRGAMYGTGITDRIREQPGGNMIMDAVLSGGSEDAALLSALNLGSEQNRPSGMPTGKFKGRDVAGNIDLDSRPIVQNEDGSVSTVRSMSFNDGEHEVLVPTVSPDGKILSNEDAIKLYRETGQHLGKFKTVEDADAYAEALHKAQEARYATPAGVDPGQTEEQSFQNWRNREQMRRMEAEENQQNPDRAAAVMAELTRMVPVGDQKFREEVAQNILDNQITPDPNIAGFGMAVSPINPVVFGAGPLNKLIGGVVDKGAEGVLRAALKPTVAGMHPIEALGVGLQKVASGTQTAGKRLSDFLTGTEDSAVAKFFDPLVVATKRPGMVLEGTGRIARDLGRQIDEGGFMGRTGVFQRAGQDAESGNFVKTVFGQGAEKERPRGAGRVAEDTEGASKPLRIGPTTAKAADWVSSTAYNLNKHGLSGGIIGVALGTPDIENAEQFGAAAGSGYALGAALSTRPVGKVVDVLNPKTSFKQKVDAVLGKDAAERRADEDADIARFRATASPEILAQTDSFGSQESHVQAWDNHISQLQQAKDELSKSGGDTKNADAQIAAAQKIRESLAKASPDQFNEVQRRINLTVADALDLAKTTGEAVGLNGLNVHFLDSSQMPEFIMNKWGKTLTDATAVIDQLGGKTDLSQSEKESLLRARETVAEVENQLQMWPNQRGFALSPNEIEEDTPAHLRMGNLQGPEIVVNADLIRSQLGTNLSHVLGHEVLVHGLGQFKEVRALMQPIREKLFGIRTKNIDGSVDEISPGIISNEALDKMAEVYGLKMGGGNPAAAAAWKSGFKDQEQLRDYMREEYLAELSGLSHNGTGDLRATLDSPGQAISDWLAVQSDNSVVGKLRDMLGLKGIVLDDQGKVSDILGTTLDPQALAMVRQYQRKLSDLNRGLSFDSSKASDVDISLSEAMTNRAVQEKTKDQDLWEKEQVYQVKDQNGNVIAEIPISSENEANGLIGEYRIENGYLVDEKGNMMELTPELRNAAIPGDAKISIENRILRNPDGSPKILTNREIRARARERNRLIREALDNAPQDGFEGRLEDIGNGVYRGTMSPSQIAAVMALPNRIVSPSLKRKIVQFNEVLQRKDGSRVIVEYQAALRGGGYKSLSPRIRDLAPIGFHFSKDGNFLAVNMSVSRMFDKLNAWVSQKPENLNLWGRDTGKFWEDVTKVLANHAAGKHAEEGLDVDPEIALQKKNRVNDFFNIFVKDTKHLNPDRTVLKTRRGQDSADRIIMSTRMDRINAMELSNAEKLPVNYEKMKVNFMPRGNSADNEFWNSARQTLSNRDAFETRDVTFNESDGPKPRRVLKSAPPQPVGDTPAFAEWQLSNMEFGADAGYTVAQLQDFAAQNKFKSGVGKEFAKDAKERITAKESDAIRDQLARDNGFEPQGEHEPNPVFRARLEAAKKDPNGVFNPKSPNYRMFLDWHGQPFTLHEQAVDYWTSSNSTSQHISAHDLVSQHGLEQAMKIAADQSSVVGKNLYGNSYGLTPKTFTTEPVGHAAGTISKTYYDLRSTPEAIRHVELNGLIEKAAEELRNIDYGYENNEVRKAKEREIRELKLEQADLATRLSAMAAVKYFSERNPNTALFSSGDHAQEIFSQLGSEAADSFKQGTKVYRGLLLDEEYHGSFIKRKGDETLASRIEKALAEDGYFDLPTRALTSWTQTEKLASTFSRHGQGQKDYNSSGTGIVITHEPAASEVVMHPGMPTYQSIFAYRKANGYKFNSGGMDQKEVILRSEPGVFRLTPENTKFVKFMPSEGGSRFSESLAEPSERQLSETERNELADYIMTNMVRRPALLSTLAQRELSEPATLFRLGFELHPKMREGLVVDISNKGENFASFSKRDLVNDPDAQEAIWSPLGNESVDDLPVTYIISNASRGFEVPYHELDEDPSFASVDHLRNQEEVLVTGKYRVNGISVENGRTFVNLAEAHDSITPNAHVWFMPDSGMDADMNLDHEAFLDHLEDNYRDGVIPVSHSLPRKFWEAAQRKGYLGDAGDFDGVFATLGDKSDFYSGKDRVHVTAHLPADKYLEHLTPDMRYDDVQHFVEEHPYADGGDVYVNAPIPLEHIVSVDGTKFMPSGSESAKEGLSLEQAEFTGLEPAALGGARVPNPMEPSDAPSAAPLSLAAAPGEVYRQKWEQARVVDGSEARPQDQKLFLVTVVKPNGERLEDTFPIRALTRDKAFEGLKDLRRKIFTRYQGKADLMVSEISPEMDSGPVDWAALRDAAR